MKKNAKEKKVFRKLKIPNKSDAEGKDELKKSLSVVDLILLGIANILGVGVFVLTGPIAATKVGPAISLSYLLTGIVSIFIGLLYAEIASIVPITGGIYTYSYVALGEMTAWFAGVCTIIIMFCAMATISTGWSSYLIGMLKSIGCNLPLSITSVMQDGGFINLPAVLLIAVVSLILLNGISQFKLISKILLIIKVSVVIAFILVAIPYVDLRNITNDFMPFGFNGIAQGVASLFLAYCGFDAIAVAAEEAKDPVKDTKIALIVSILFCAVIYIIISFLLTSIAPYTSLNSPDSMVTALALNGSNIGSILITVGTIGGVPAGVLIQGYGLSRILFAMSRDGMLPKCFSYLTPKKSVPIFSILTMSIICMLIAGFLPLMVIADLVNIALLFSSIFVAVAVIKLRIDKPNIERPFKCPYIWLVGSVSILVPSYLIYDLLSHHQELLTSLFYIIIGSLAIYFGYGIRNSKLNYH